MAIDDVWARGRQWSALAGARTRTLKRWRRANLALVFAGAVLGALATQESWFGAGQRSALGGVGAAALGLAVAVQTGGLRAERVRQRVIARTAAESVKAAVFQYLAGVSPYDGPNRDAALDSALDDVASRADVLAADVADTRPDATPPPSFTGVEGYVAQRARPQLDFHSAGRTRHRTLERRWRAAEAVATAAAAVLSGIGGSVTGFDLSAWVGVATTLATAFAAHLAGEQHARIAASYALTADDLDRLLRSFDAATAEPAAAAELVLAVETVLARQNETWVSTLAPKA